uniref:Uncharacterized protein n=1 Tax=Anguilla anguilla TaxID=7936 RepID=A0A0E9VDS2_ANGAN
MIICTHATRENCWLIQNKNNPFPNLSFKLLNTAVNLPKPSDLPFSKP